MAGKAGEVLRNLLALAGVFALGYWLAGARAVHASSDDVQFELQGVNENSSLLVYQPSTKTVYVYRGAMAGNSALQCNFMFQMTKPGGVIHRENCAVQTAAVEAARHFEMRRLGCDDCLDRFHNCCNRSR